MEQNETSQIGSMCKGKAIRNIFKNQKIFPDLEVSNFLPKKHWLYTKYVSMLKGKVWSKIELHRLVLCVKERQSVTFLKTKKYFLT